MHEKDGSGMGPSHVSGGFGSATLQFVNVTVKDAGGQVVSDCTYGVTWTKQ